MKPLAERMRPQDLDQVLGQGHIIGTLKQMLETGFLPSMIFWGPPGVGKTSLARIMGQSLHRDFFVLSAVSSGVKDLREVIDRARHSSSDQASPILFIDEIHRFNKAQQDALLAAVEEGTICLIGATTENPSFEVNSALLSRMQVYVLKALDENDLLFLVNRILKEDPTWNQRNVQIHSHKALFQLAGGDARKLCNIMEILSSIPEDPLMIDDMKVFQTVQRNVAKYDKDGEIHYDQISALIKSVRGSDPHAALYWMARMADAGEDPVFIARRLVILASEDIGLANPNALLMAQACMSAVHQIGWPECRIVLAQTVIYLACSPKSNSAYMAIEKALSWAKLHAHEPVPLHLRNAPTSLMKDLDYGKDYRYSHHSDHGFSDQEYMPEALIGKKMYEPLKNVQEQKFEEVLLKLWAKKYQ